MMPDCRSTESEIRSKRGTAKDGHVAKTVGTKKKKV